MNDQSIIAGTEMNALAERYYGTDGNRKPTIYLAEYERLFAPMRRQPLRLLELGVTFGASMCLWRDYFPRGTIVGLDLADKPVDFPDDSRIRFVQGSQDNPDALDDCAYAAGGAFDIIIDDASHIGHLTAAAFAHLFPRYLKPGGYYVIEDICTAFMPEFPDSEPFNPRLGSRDGRHFPSHQAGMVGAVKQLLDHVQSPLAGNQTRFPIERMTVLTNMVILRKSP